MRPSAYREVLIAGVLTLGATLIPSARALDAFPSSTVRILVPTAPGGSADAVPRILAEALSTAWGKPVVVENVTGAGGNIGAEQFSRAAADGHLLMASPPNSLAINQSLYKKISYDPKAFVPITILGSAPNILIVNPTLGVASASELIAKAKANPGTISYASQGAGSTGHLTGAMFEMMAGIKLNHIPYRGTGPAMNDLLGGHVGMMFDPALGASLPQHHSGALRIIAICADERVAALPEVPTMSESALRGFVSMSWFGLVAPPGTPADVVAKINTDVAAALKLQEVRDKIVRLGVGPIGNSSKEAAAFIERERNRWSSVIDQAKIQIE